MSGLESYILCIILNTYNSVRESCEALTSDGMTFCPCNATSCIVSKFVKRLTFTHVENKIKLCDVRVYERYIKTHFNFKPITRCVC